MKSNKANNNNSDYSLNCSWKFWEIYKIMEQIKIEWDDLIHEIICFNNLKELSDIWHYSPFKNPASLFTS